MHPHLTSVRARTASLKILSLGRNVIKEFRNGLDPVAGTLEQLWISYNSIDKLTGISVCKKLRVLYMTNNLLSKWSEIEKLVSYSLAVFFVCSCCCYVGFHLFVV